MNDRVTPRELLRRLRAAYGLALRTCAGSLTGQVAVAAVIACAPVVTAWLTKLVVDEVSANGANLGRLTAAGTGLACAGIALATATALTQYLQNRTRRATGLLAHDRLFSAVNRLRGMSTVEQPAFRDRLRLAQQSADNTPDQLISAGLRAAQGLLGIAGFITTLWILNPVLALVIVAAALPGLAAQILLSRERADLLWRTSPTVRRELFYRGLLIDLQAAKEIRLFGLGRFLHERMLRERRSVNDSELRLDAKVARRQVVLSVLGAALSGIGLVWTALSAARHTLTVGDVAIFVTGTVGVQMAAATVVQSLATAHHAALMFGHFAAVAEVEDDLPVSPSPRSLPPLRDGIRLHDVWYRYGEDAPWVLRGVDLEIPRGRSVAIVGLNGAGKSTLVRLLCRLADPQRGTVSWDGVDVREVDADELRSRISAVFQDYMCYDLTAAENIAVGDLRALDDRDRVEAAAVDAGIHPTVSGLPRGYDTVLSRMFVADGDTGNGTTLSGGQWQRIAVARALLRSGRDLIVLDEPSAGLDALAEADLFRRLRGLGAEHTSVLVSHSLRAVREADKVVVLSEGRISEQGSHDELMTADGVYAGLFRSQAEGYLAKSEVSR